VLLLVLVTAVLAVARLTRLVVKDRIALGLRRSVVKRWGEESMAAYFAHCPWCMSIWFSLVVMPVAVFWPNRYVLAVLAIPAASYVTGLLAEREGD
jgi:hypothetical protein